MAAAADPKASTSKCVENVLQATGQELTGDTPVAKKRKPVGLKPGTRWDGRVSNLSLKDYRELKWNLDASYAKVERRGPSYTCRAFCPRRNYSSPVFCRGDPVKCLDYVKPHGQSYSMGQQSIVAELTRSPGPAQYMNPSTMDPNRHPILKKSLGARFGSELLLSTDSPGPAPGDYDDVASFKRSGACTRMPNYTIQGREAWHDPPVAPGPGVGEYPGLETCQRHGKDTPIQWTCQGKTEPIEPPRGERKNTSPGPPHYNAPGAGFSCKNEHVNNPRPSKWKFGSETRGLV